jgi:hypothetical protein
LFNFHLLTPEEQAHEGNGEEGGESQKWNRDKIVEVDPRGGAGDAAVAHGAVGEQIGFWSR